MYIVLCTMYTHCVYIQGVTMYIVRVHSRARLPCTRATRATYYLYTCTGIIQVCTMSSRTYLYVYHNMYIQCTMYIQGSTRYSTYEYIVLCTLYHVRGTRYIVHRVQGTRYDVQKVQVQLLNIVLVHRTP